MIMGNSILSSSHKITDANDADSEWIKIKINEYESKLLPDENIREVRIIMKNEENENIGGLLGNTRFATLYINDIWINEDERKKGYGRELIQMAENKAKELGCKYSSLGTFDVLKVKRFYKKIGYRVTSKNKDSPEGLIGYWFTKKLK
jgi:GNAT superfamily N-acetyltransferase